MFISKSIKESFSMIKLIARAFYVSMIVILQLFAMQPVQHSLQSFPKDEFGIVTCYCNLQSLGRLKSTNKHFNRKITMENIENILRNPSYSYFLSVEQYLYHHAPKFMQMKDPNNKQRLQEILSGIIVAHAEKIDAAIVDLYESMKKTSSFAINELKLDEQIRLTFYCGKLPRKINADEHIDRMKENRFPEKNPDWSAKMIAHVDAFLAATALKNIPRLKVILDRYEQFPTGPEGLFVHLCKLHGCSDLVINYISSPDRGMNYTEKSLYNAHELADYYKNKQLMDDLDVWSKQKNN